MEIITLTVKGTTRIFEREDLEEILEEYYDLKEAQQEDEYTEVDLRKIDWGLFEKERTDLQQEKIRRIILEALDAYRNHTRKENFTTWVPINTWGEMTANELESLAYKRGDSLASWFHQALEWAQKITNGKTWEAICNNPDTAKYRRIVRWKSPDALRLIGGSTEYLDTRNYPPSYISEYWCVGSHLYEAVPLIVFY